ncbi:hypothetical protein STAS_18273 [Striga asiatica]|uniref:CUE domain-containing protein n=1 Tax=Striga asiatica TaxID=4170 RepID=A0A5A7Q9A6_STRAF|nr:hypothetical protein STAS_18273 [Striga asiatica]
MSAVVCGKRSNIFEDSPSSPPISKRIRCSSSSSSSSQTFSPPTANSFSPVLDHLAALFPDTDSEFLEKALEEAGDDLDSAIKRLNELRLSAAASVSDISQEIGNQFCSEVVNSGEVPHREEKPAESILPVDGAEWVELLVREVLSAPNLDDAKARLSRALEALEKSICVNATSEAAKSFQEGNIMVKQQLEALLQENVILKRAVSIQHERHKAFEKMSQELHQLKQLVSQYQERIRSLEVNNYALAMHLKQAQQSSPFPGRFPDVF